MSRLEQNDDRLQALLRFKRYERPPPGYFLSFSGKVIHRIEAEQASAYSTWWTWLVERFDAKPVVVGVYGCALSALLFAGFRLSQAFEAEAGAVPTLSGPCLAATPASHILLADELAHPSFGGTVPSAPLGVSRVFGSAPDGFSTPFGGLRVQPVHFTVPEFK